MKELEFCQHCVNKSFDPNTGINCGLTNAKPDFENECPDFKHENRIATQQSESNTEYSIENSLHGSRFRDNSERSKYAIVMIWIVFLMEAVMLLSSAMQYQLLESVSQGVYYSDAELEANDTREGLVALAYLVVFVISAIKFIQWFRRAYYNLHTLSKNLEFEEGQASSCWFIPFVNLVRPYRIMKELYQESIKILETKRASFTLTTSMLGLWWFLWIISGLIGQISFRLSNHATTVEDFILTTGLDAVSSILGLVLCIVTAKVVKDHSKAEAIIFELE